MGIVDGQRPSIRSFHYSFFTNSKSLLGAAQCSVLSQRAFRSLPDWSPPFLYWLFCPLGINHYATGPKSHRRILAVNLSYTDLYITPT